MNISHLNFSAANAWHMARLDVQHPKEYCLGLNFHSFVVLIDRKNLQQSWCS
jgi:hypothetical protein